MSGQTTPTMKPASERAPMARMDVSNGMPVRYSTPPYTSVPLDLGLSPLPNGGNIADRTPPRPPRTVFKGTPGEQLAGAEHAAANPLFGEMSDSPVRRSEDETYTPKSVPMSVAQIMASPGPPPSAPMPSMPPAGELFQPIRAAQQPAAARVAPGANVPVSPAWCLERPMLSGDFILYLEDRNTQPLALQKDAPSVQEVKIMDDLLYAFLGLSGRYIKARKVTVNNQPQIMFVIDCVLQPAIRQQVERLLPICESVVIIQRFVEVRSAYHYGKVSHATAAAMRALLEDWKLMVVQLEHQLRLGQLTLQSMWYYCQPPMAALQLLGSIAAQVSKQQLSSVGVLDVLHSKLMQLGGDAQARLLLTKLLHTASLPYFQVLERWLCEGVVDDPYKEFMVESNPHISQDNHDKDGHSQFWTEKFTLRQRKVNESADDVPVVLQNCKTNILLAGKYLNVMKQCGKPIQRPLSADLHLQYDAAELYVQHINSACRNAGRALLEFLMVDMDLMSWLASIKHYFFLDQGDFLTSFMDLAEGELNKTADEPMNSNRLKSLLELAVRTSSVGSDPHHDRVGWIVDNRSFVKMQQAAVGINKDVKPTMMQESLMPDKSTKKYGKDMFLLTYDVSWPISIVVSLKETSQYQLVFKLVFLLKCAERDLSRVWQTFQETKTLAGSKKQMKRTGGEEAYAPLRQCYLLVQRMMFFVHQFLRFITFQVLEPQWHIMQQSLQQASTVDEVIEGHRACLDKVLRGCLLSRPKILRMLVNLLKCMRELHSVADAASRGIDNPEREEEEKKKRKAAASAAKTGKDDEEEPPLTREELLQKIVGVVTSALFAANINRIEQAFHDSYGVFTRALEAEYEQLLAGNKNVAVATPATPTPTTLGGIDDSDARNVKPQSAVATREDLETIHNLIMQLRVDNDSTFSFQHIRDALSGASR